MSESILSRRKAFFLSPETSSISFANRDSLSSTQFLVDGLVTRFVDEAADVKTLAALTAGGLAYRYGKIGVMGLNVGAYGHTPLRMASVVFGLASEVTAFEFTSRTLSSVSVRAGLKPAPTASVSPFLWSWEGQGGWKQSLINDLFTFGLLKGAGYLSRESNVVFQHAFSSTAMVAGHQTTALFGVTPRPEGSLAEQFLHAEITNLQLGAGTSLVHSMAPGIVALERGLDLSLQTNPRATGRSPLQIGPRLVLAEGIDDAGGFSPSPLRDLKKNSHILQMSAPEDSSSGGSIGRTASIPSSEVVSDRSHSLLSLASQLGVDVSSFREGQDFNNISKPLRTQVMGLISRPEISLSLSSGSLQRLRQFVIGGVEPLSEVEGSLQELVEKGREKNLIVSPVMEEPAQEVPAQEVPLEPKEEEEEATPLPPPIIAEAPPETPSKVVTQPQERVEAPPQSPFSGVDPQLREARIEIDRLIIQLGRETHKAGRAAELEARVRELEQLLQNANDALDTATNDHATVSARVTELEKDLGDKEKELEAALSAGATSHSRAEGWKQSHDELKERTERIVREYRAQAEGLEVEMKKVRAKNDHISQSRIETLDQSIELESRLRGQLSESEIKVRRLTNLVGPTQRERDQANRIVEEKERELVGLRGKIAELEDELKELAALKASLGEALLESYQAKVLMGAARKDVDRINGYRLRAIEVRKRTNEQTRAAFGELREQVRDQKETIEALRREKTQLIQDRDLEKARADQEKARADALALRVGELEVQLEDLKGKLEKAHVAITLAERRLEARKTQLEGEQKSAIRLREEIERLKAVIGEASRQAEAKDARIRELHAKIRELEEIEDISSSVVSEEETQMKEDLERLEGEKQSLIHELSTARGLLGLRDKQIAGALKRAASLEAQLARAREALGAKEREYGELLRRFTAVDLESVGLRAEAGMKARAVEALARQVDENNRLRARNQEVQGKVTKANEDIQRLRDDLEFAQGDVALSEGALKENQSELAKANQALEAKKTELKQIKDELFELRRNGRTQESRITQLTRRETYLSERVGKLETERDDLRKKVGAK